MRRFHWIDLLTIAYAAFIVYGSLIPFDLSLPAPSVQGPSWLGVPVIRSGFPDAVSNLALYLPFGMLLHGWLFGRGTRGIAAAGLAVAAAGTLSFTIESLQLMSASRISSWADIISNVIGMAVGYAISLPESTLARRFIPAIGGDLSRAPTAVAAGGWAAALIVTFLIPFDLTFEVSYVARAVRQAYIVPFVKYNEFAGRVVETVGGHVAAQNPEAMTALWQLRLDYGVQVISFAALAVLVAWHLHSTARRLQEAVIGAAAVGVMIAVALTCAGLFVRSVGFDSTHAVLGSIGTAAGAIGFAAFQFMTRRRTERVLESIGPRDAMPRMALASVLICWTYIAARELVPYQFDFSETARNLARIEWLPLQFYTFAKVPDAVADVLHKAFRFGALGAAMMVFSLSRDGRCGGKRCLRYGLIAAAGVALMEVLQCCIPARYPSITDVINAGVSAASGAALAKIVYGWIGQTMRDTASARRARAAMFNVELPPPAVSVPNPGRTRGGTVSRSEAVDQG